MKRLLTLLLVCATIGTTAITAITATAAQADPMRPLAAMRAASAPAATQVSAPATAGGVARTLPAFELRGDTPPTAPAGAGAGDRPLPALVAIREDASGQRRALFGEDWLAAGQSLPGRTPQVRVAAIGATHVDLQEGKQRRTLHLLPPLETAKPAAARQAAPTTASNTASNTASKTVLRAPR